MSAATLERPRSAPPEVLAAPGERALEAAGEAPFRWDVTRYERMVAAGILGPGDNIYLWKGVLIQKMTKHPPHAIATTILYKRLVRLAPDEHDVRQEQPVVFEDDSMPEPDLTIVRGTAHQREVRHPRADELAMIVEVADSSLLIGRRGKLVDYARAGIPTYWIVNLPEKCVEVHEGPSGPTASPSYATKRTHGLEEGVPLRIDDRELGQVAVRDLLPIAPAQRDQGRTADAP